ncbi:MAG: hypothetical protein [Bacteriophage sp.]|nr:MAG: hypothetical protein [Bacteriophage sp.]
MIRIRKRMMRRMMRNKMRRKMRNKIRNKIRRMMKNKRRRMMKSNRFRFIINNIISIRKIDRRDSSRTKIFSISQIISTFTTIIIILISTFNLNLTLFEPHPTPPSHSPRTLQCPLSSPYPLSPHSIPLVTSSFTSITFLL